MSGSGRKENLVSVRGPPQPQQQGGSSTVSCPRTVQSFLKSSPQPQSGPSRSGEYHSPVPPTRAARPPHRPAHRTAPPPPVQPRRPAAFHLFGCREDDTLDRGRPLHPKGSVGCGRRGERLFGPQPLLLPTPLSGRPLPFPSPPPPYQTPRCPH